VDVGAEGGAAHGRVASVAVAPQGHRAAGAGRDGLDDGGDVFELALDRVSGHVAAGAGASAIHGIAGDVRA